MRLPVGAIRRSFATSGARQHLQRVEVHAIARRCLSSLSVESPLDGAKVHFCGEGRYGRREYVLLPSDRTLDDLNDDPKLKLASIHAHENVVFGARILREDLVDNADFVDVCGPLLDAALEDASEPGQQPQALSTLNGLCSWVAENMKQEGEARSENLIALEKDDARGFEAVKAIASGVPRPGQVLVGGGTFRDGKAGWEALAKEFVALEKSDEANLYKSRGGELVAIEYMADKSEAYLKTAGGAMARFFFL